MKKAIYKARIIIDDNNKVEIVSYFNRLIPCTILYSLNEAVHRVREELNGQASWKRYYIRFEHEGKTYQQYENTKGYCVGCCFHDKKLVRCKHPHYEDGTKGSCRGLIYKRIK